MASNLHWGEIELEPTLNADPAYCLEVLSMDVEFNNEVFANYGDTLQKVLRIGELPPNDIDAVLLSNLRKYADDLCNSMVTTIAAVNGIIGTAGPY